jgi:hypothetical protein
MPRSNPFYFSEAPQAAWAFNGFNPSLGEIGKRKVTLSAEKTDALEALKGLLKSANASYIIGGEVDKGGTVTFNFQDVPLEEALGAVAEAGGLHYHVRGNVIVLQGRGTSSYAPAAFSIPSGGVPILKEMPYVGDLFRTPPHPEVHILQKDGVEQGRLYRQDGKDFVFTTPKPESSSQRRPGVKAGIAPSTPYAEGQYPLFLGDRADFRLRKFTVRELFKKFGLRANAKDDYLVWDEDSDKRGKLPKGIHRISGDADSHDLHVEGDPDALNRFRDEAHRAQGD